MVNQHLTCVNECTFMSICIAYYVNTYMYKCFFSWKNARAYICTFLEHHFIDDGPFQSVQQWFSWKYIEVLLTSVRTRQNFQARALGDFHDRVSSAARAWGHKFSSEAMHVYTGENRFSLWIYHIGTVFKSIQLSISTYRVITLVIT